jgi:membrane protease YdiL (CAAX protease family)
MREALTVWLLLAAFAAMLVAFLVTDRRTYRRFKLLTATRDRQLNFAKWIGQSAVLFGGGALAALAILGRLPAVQEVPAEFVYAAAAMPHLSLAGQGVDLAVGLGIGFGIGLVALFVTLRLMRRKDSQPKTFTAGDIEPLLPRNGAERVWALLIALNAGWCEELFFRLMLPLLLTLATGNVLLAFGIAVAVFGLVHLYQGIAGILATAVLGALFTAVYLATGNIWIAAALHAVVDINGLILQPLLRGTLSK